MGPGPARTGLQGAPEAGSRVGMFSKKALVPSFLFDCMKLSVKKTKKKKKRNLFYSLEEMSCFRCIELLDFIFIFAFKLLTALI